MLQGQAFDIAQIVLLGVALGMLIDIYRVTTRMLNPGKYLAALFDLLFWLTAAIWAFVYLLRVNSGEARLYVLALLFLGYLLEQKVLGAYLRANLRAVLMTIGKGLSRLISAISVCLDTVLDFIAAPFRFVVRLLLRPLVWLVNLAFAPLRAMVRRVRQLLRRMRTLVTQWWAGEEPKE